MERIFKFHHEQGENFVDLGNIKSIYTSDFGAVTIYLLKSFDYVVNPETNKLELLEPTIQFWFNKPQKAIDFTKTLSEKWGKYLEIKETE